MILLFDQRNKTLQKVNGRSLRTISVAMSGCQNTQSVPSYQQKPQQKL